MSSDNILVETSITIIDPDTVTEEVSCIKISSKQYDCNGYISICQIDPDTDEKTSEVVITRNIAVELIKGLQLFLKEE